MRDNEGANAYLDEIDLQHKFLADEDEWKIEER
jgi:hypothetical protein